jgi:exopolyphosphatase / guanosine-5'-triphosphate,3'-diphosphate pyrophosphatase
MIASIDIGSNSILLLIANVENNKLSILYRDSHVTALGKGLDATGKFDAGSMHESLQVLKLYSEKIKEFGLLPQACLATATEASRVALNAKEFYHEVLKQTDISVQIINGKGEAYYSALGASFELPSQFSQVTIMDIGGASTELIKVKLHPFQIIDSVSIPVGSVRMTNWREDGVLAEKMAHLEQSYNEIITSFKTSNLLCVAGTMTSIANMHLNHKEFVENEVHMHEMTFESLKNIFDKSASANSDKLLAEFPFLGKRAKAIAGGISVAYYFCNKLSVKNITVSTYGLMFGTALEQKIKTEYLATKA